MNGRSDDIDIRLDFEDYNVVYNIISTGIEHWMMSKALIFRAWKLKIKRSENIDYYVSFRSGRLGYNITRLGMDVIKITIFVFG